MQYVISTQKLKSTSKSLYLGHMAKAFALMDCPSSNNCSIRVLGLRAGKESGKRSVARRSKVGIERDEGGKVRGFTGNKDHEVTVVTEKQEARKMMAKVK